MLRWCAAVPTATASASASAVAAADAVTVLVVATAAAGVEEAGQAGYINLLSMLVMCSMVCHEWRALAQVPLARAQDMREAAVLRRANWVRLRVRARAANWIAQQLRQYPCDYVFCVRSEPAFALVSGAYMCAGCCSVRYCGPECQRLARPYHKYACYMP